MTSVPLISLAECVERTLEILFHSVRSDKIIFETKKTIVNFKSPFWARETTDSAYTHVEWMIIHLIYQVTAMDGRTGDSEPIYRNTKKKFAMGQG